MEIWVLFPNLPAANTHRLSHWLVLMPSIDFETTLVFFFTTMFRLSNLQSGATHCGKLAENSTKKKNESSLTKVTKPFKFTAHGFTRLYILFATFIL